MQQMWGTFYHMTIAINKIIVPVEHRRITSGQSVSISAEFIDVDNVKNLIDPNSQPLITVRDKDNVVVANEQGMTKLSQGLYNYSLQTLSTFTIGAYTGDISAIHSGEVARVDKAGLFVIERQSTLTNFSYIRIQDQSNNVWYWHINIVPEVDPNPSTPVVLNKLANEITPVTVPHWLEVDNTDSPPVTRYVYPDIVGGAPLVATTAPGIGTGHASPLAFVSLNNQSYNIRVNLLEQVILVSV